MAMNNELKVGDLITREHPGTIEPFKVCIVREGKVVLRSVKFPHAKAVTVKIDNIGSHRNSGTTFYRSESP